MRSGAASVPLERPREDVVAVDRRPLSICESRECGNAEHSGEAVCKQILGREERRRELQGQGL